jgi:hypothetical protein
MDQNFPDGNFKIKVEQFRVFWKMPFKKLLTQRIEFLYMVQAERMQESTPGHRLLIQI